MAWPAHTATLKNQAMVCTIGHFDNEIVRASSRRRPESAKTTHLAEKVVRLHLAQLGVKLTKLRPDQTDYIGIPANGPYKPNHYRD